jgi:hypothetical protein
MKNRKIELLGALLFLFGALIVVYYNLILDADPPLLSQVVMFGGAVLASVTVLLTGTSKTIINLTEEQESILSTLEIIQYEANEFLGHIQNNDKVAQEKSITNIKNFASGLTTEVETDEIKSNTGLLGARELEEVLFLVSDLLHNSEHNQIDRKDIDYIMIEARLFTRYASQDRPDLSQRHKDFINFLKNDMWKKIHGRVYDDFNK